MSSAVGQWGENARQKKSSARLGSSPARLEVAQANHRDRCVELLDPELAEYLEEEDL